jgi:thymidylate synthase (FAD)
VLEITTTRDISRQILRHRSFSFQEFSQRYAEVKTLVDREPREQDIKNRQNSFAMPSSDWRVAEWYKQLHRLIATAKWTYDHAIEMGIAKEQARVVLPEGLTETVMYMAGNIRSWIHYCEVRRGPETQLEHRNIANACWSIITNEMPSLATILD